MDVALDGLLYLAAGVDVVHVGIEDELEHHLRMEGATAFLLVQLFEILEVKTFYYGIDNAHRIVFRDILAGIHRQKQSVVIVIFCM